MRHTLDMKRYRLLSFDFDSTPSSLEDINPVWEETIKERHRSAQRQQIAQLIFDLGFKNFDQKIKDLLTLGNKRMSILAFHNRFFEQIRVAFTAGSYYPALTGACALGERILNHLVLSLRDSYQGSQSYKRVYRKDSFDDWAVPIEALDEWQVLLPDTKVHFEKLRKIRNNAIHFRPETDANDRQLAVDAITELHAIIASQFSAIGTQPWFIPITFGEMYIKKSWETNPFIDKIYLPHCKLLSPAHRIEIADNKIFAIDNAVPEAPSPEISDEDFMKLRQDSIAVQVKRNGA